MARSSSSVATTTARCCDRCSARHEGTATGPYPDDEARRQLHATGWEDRVVLREEIRGRMVGVWGRADDFSSLTPCVRDNRIYNCINKAAPRW